MLAFTDPRRLGRVRVREGGNLLTTPPLSLLAPDGLEAAALAPAAVAEILASTTVRLVVDVVSVGGGVGVVLDFGGDGGGGGGGGGGSGVVREASRLVSRPFEPTQSLFCFGR